MFCRKKQSQYRAVPVSEVPGKQEGYTGRPVGGDTTEVSANHIARLMYYLHCVKNCVDIRIRSTFTDFKHFFLLTESEKRDVVIYAHRFRPSVMKDVIFFEVDANSQWLTSVPNNFLDFNDPVTATFHMTTNEIVMERENYIIKKVMIYKPMWMFDFFEAPFREEQWRIGLSPGMPYRFIGVNHRNYPVGFIDVPFWCLGGLIWFFIVPPVGLTCLAIGACRAGCEMAKPDNYPMTTTYVVY